MYQWFAFAVFMTIVNSGTPLKCYECTECPEPFDPKTAVTKECPPENKGNNDILKIFEVADNVGLDDEFVCVTYSMKILAAKKNLTQRSCAPKTVVKLDFCDYLSKYFPSSAEILNCATCNTDLCNA